MFKLLMVPGVLALAVLLLIAVFSKKGNVVSEAAKSVGPANHRYGGWILSFAGFGLAWIAFALAAMHYHFHPDLVYVVWAGSGALLILLAFAMLTHMAIDFVIELAPAAAQIGERLSNDQKRAVLRHGMRWFRKFRKA